MSIRSTLESVTRSWSYWRSVRVGGRSVRFLVSPSAGLRFLFWRMSRIDPTTVRLVEDLVPEAAVVWDVGANVGFFSFPAAAMAGRSGCVIAFEPDPWLVNLLHRSASAQPTTAAPVRVLPVAVARANAIRLFSFATRARSSNHLAEYGLSQTGGVRESKETLAIDLDWAAGFLPAPTVLKIDVEGAELEVLAGASSLIRTHQPLILIEAASELAQPISDFLHAHGYRLWNGETREPVTKATWSTVGVPASRPDFTMPADSRERQ
jgi:FkbM family methyltransferase